MNASLAKAVSALSALPEPDQQEPPRACWPGSKSFVRTRALTQEQIAGVEAARAEARAGRFANDDDMAEDPKDTRP